MAEPNTAVDREAPEVLPSKAGSQTVEASAGTDDDSVILWMLSLSATRRLEVAQGFVDSVAVLRNARRA
jgi:hypothetical protein